MTKMTGFSSKGIAKARKVGAKNRANDAILISFLPTSDEISLKLRNRATVNIGVKSIVALRGIQKDHLQRIRLSPLGDAIELPDHDVHVSVAGVVRQAVFGEDPYARAGSAKSAAKTVSSRANGKRGGRPKRSQAATSSASRR